MTQFLFSPRGRLVSACAAITCLLAVVTASSASARERRLPTEIDTTTCVYPELTQPFLSVRDSHQYALTPGQSVDSFNGDGWTLSGGAQVVSADVADGSSGQVLDLPSGARAVSPPMCVDNGFKTARTMVRTVTGGDDIDFSVAFDGTDTWTKPKSTGHVHGEKNGWTISNPVNVQPSNDPGWQVVRFSFVAGGKASDFQIYNFYVDPRMK